MSSAERLDERIRRGESGITIDTRCTCGHRAGSHKNNGECGLIDSSGLDCGCTNFTILCTCGHGEDEHTDSTCIHMYIDAVERESVPAVENGTGTPGQRGYQKSHIRNPYCICEGVVSETEMPTITNSESETEIMPDTYPLPNGGTYIARPLSGFKNDVEGLRELVEQGNNVLLLGEPGCGKTALMQAAFPDSENEIGHSKMTAPDMLWRPRIDPKAEHGVTYDPSPLTRAATMGKKLYVDEIMRMGDDGFTPLFSAMDGRGFIVGGNLDGTDMPVKPGFGVVGASNPLVRGAFLPDAIASRFHILNVETSEKLLKALKLDEKLLTVWNNLRNQDKGEVWKPSIRELLAAQKFLDGGNPAQAAFAITGWRIPSRDRERVADLVGPIFGVRVDVHGGVIK